MTSFENYIKKFEERISKYIVPQSEWGPVEKAIYGVKDLYRVEPKEANELRFKSIKFQFKRQYEKNTFYRKMCKNRNVSPDDIKSHDDLLKIPLLEDRFFKNYPDGKEFAVWLANIFTGELPEIEIRKKKPSYDDILKDFNSAGLVISHSSGTSGKHTFIPRDKRTFDMAEYSFAKAVATMIYPFWEYDISAYLLMPNPFKTFLFAGKVCSVLYDAVKDVTPAIDKRITTEIISLLMRSRGIKAKIVRFSAALSNRKMIKRIVSWLEENERKGRKIAFIGAPYILHEVMEYLRKEGKTFSFEDRGAVVTGGGWKIQEDKRLPVDVFREDVEKILGINKELCLDLYGMVEGNGAAIHCPEGHYLHLPTTFYYPLVVDENLEPVDYGEYGRFAFLDATAYSYPGFIITGDRVRMLEHCPVCDRPGPVLEPEVKRVKGEEVRGCAEEVRRMLSIDS